MITQTCDACGRIIKLDDMITCSNCASQDDQLIRDYENQVNELMKEIEILQDMLDKISSTKNNE
jgi:hypothetical protein